MQTSESIDKLAAALSAAQGELRHAEKDRDNPFFKSRYATLASVLDACREPLAKNGLAVCQVVEGDEQRVTVTTRLMHASGQWIEGVFGCKPKQADAQSMGSAASYGRRYGLSAIVGVGVDDDDGNAASAQARQSPTSAPATPKPAQAKPATPTALDVAMTAGRQATTVDELTKAFHAAVKSGASATQQDELRARKQALQTPDVGFDSAIAPCKMCGSVKWTEKTENDCSDCTLRL